MRSFLSRRSFLMTTATLAASTAVLAGCVSGNQMGTEHYVDVSQGPVLVMEGAVARPANTESLLNELSGEKLKHFDRIFFVNKGAWGPYSQQLKIMKPDVPGAENTAWRVERSFEISTGREKQERYFTTTPRGLFTFNASRRHRDYQSRQWDGADMPFAMFLDYIYPNGRPTGIAFHSTNPETEAFLGMRSSGGCIRVSMDESAELFDYVAQFPGRIPDFVDMDPRGLLQHNADGSVKMKSGHRILIVVEDNKNIEWERFGPDSHWRTQLKRNAVWKNYEKYVAMLEEGAAAGQN